MKINTPLLILIAILSLTSNAWGYESFIGIGYQQHDVKFDLEYDAEEAVSGEGNGFHLSIGLRNHYGRDQQHLFGGGIDIDEILGNRLIGYRALDYQYQLNRSIRLGGFFGAASLDSGLPQNGYYTGASFSYVNIIDDVDITFELRHANGLARDRRGATPEGSRPDIFLDFTSIATYISWRF
ncbi:MAG: hypothetical protein K6L80_03705 [Agarilytica sp.]